VHEFVEEFKGVKVVEVSNDGHEVEICYDEREDKWFFSVNGRKRVVKSLIEARSKVKGMVVGNKGSKLKPFEVLMIGEIPYWINQFQGFDDKNAMKRVRIVGLSGEDASGKFQAVEARIKQNGNKNYMKDTWALKGNWGLVFKTKENEEKVGEFLKKARELYAKKVRLEQEARELDSVYKVEKEKFIEKLNKLEVMEDFEWDVLSQREWERQKEERKSEVVDPVTGEKGF